MKVIIVTGLSGAGKSQAINCLEDMGYYCIDNMPPALIKNFLNLAGTGKGSSIEKAALVIDVRGGEFFADAKASLEDLDKSTLDYKLIFLEASKEVLIRRYNETRRTHPLSETGSVQEGIEKETELLSEIRKMADFVINTSNMKTARLREEIRNIINDEGEDENNFIINIKSFGYKYGIPLDSDLVFDMRFIPNPFYIASLKNLSGNNKKVQDFVMRHEESQRFLETVYRLVDNLIPFYAKEGKYHLNISFGCTGGHHRSVTIANKFSEKSIAQGKRITIEHRDL
ncbi:MAG: RNase adapter RapZ [Eubacteriales bacterium]|nr:RNase adapter RapZ [Eubacteriales bacterium]MDD4389786.1 RNase adapter RapZ [Eubacteriales bacterium]